VPSRNAAYFLDQMNDEERQRSQQPRHGLRPEGRRHLRRVQDGRGDLLAISIPRGEAPVIRHFQERMPYGLRDVAAG
jgi:hypothetical protein